MRNKRVKTKSIKIEGGTNDCKIKWTTASKVNCYRQSGI